ncbi:MAG: hypothetical protein ACOC6G_04510 [Thermoproteota archaeon]
MSHSETGSGVIESKVFVVTFVFNLIGGGHQSVIRLLPLFLSQVGYTNWEIGVFNVFLRGLHFLFTPVLFFVILYYVCSGNLLDRITSVLVSLILGSLVGFWIGGILATGLVTSQWEGTLGGVMYVLYGLPYVPLSQMLLGFSVLAFFEVNKEWRDALSVEDRSIERPTGVTLLSVLYILSAVLNFCAVPVSRLYPSLLTLYTLKLLIFVTVVATLILSGGGQILIAKGLYSGRRWGWAAAFISSATSLLVTVTLIYLTVFHDGFKFGWLTFTALIGLIVGAIIFFYLLSFHVRQYYGMVNPPENS